MQRISATVHSDGNSFSDPNTLISDCQRLIGQASSEIQVAEYSKRRNESISVDFDAIELKLEQAKSLADEVSSGCSSGSRYAQVGSRLSAEVDLLGVSLKQLRKFATNTNARARQYTELLGNSAPSAVTSRGGQQGAVPSQREADLRRAEAEALLHTSAKLRSMVHESNAIYDALKNQRGTLQGTKGKLVTDFLKSIGMSDETIQQIGRTRRDRFIVYGGIFIITCLMIYIWFK